MNASVTWDKGLKFAAVADSGVEIGLGSGKDSPGVGPMEMVLMGLIGCTAMDVISILEKKRQKVTAFKVTAEAERAESYPKVFTKIKVHYLVTGHEIDPRAVERSMELSETKYCPVQAMLSQAVPIELSYEVIAA